MQLNKNMYSDAVYPVIRKYQRLQRNKQNQYQYKHYTGYVGERYKRIDKKQQKYYTMKSVYTRHRQILKKYEYDYDLESNQLLKNLKNKFSQQLYKYLTLFGNQFLCQEEITERQKKFQNLEQFQSIEKSYFKVCRQVRSDQLQVYNAPNILFNKKQDQSQPKEYRKIVNLIQMYIFSNYETQPTNEVNLLNIQIDLSNQAQQRSSKFATNESQIFQQDQKQCIQKDSFSWNRKKFMRFYSAYKHDGYGKTNKHTKQYNGKKSRQNCYQSTTNIHQIKL